MAPETPIVGQVLGHYRVVEQIGAGGMGLVFRASDQQLERDMPGKFHRVAGCIVGGVSTVRIGVAREFSGCSTRFERGSPSRRPRVLADRFNGTFDCRCLLDLLGHYRNTNLGLGRTTAQKTRGGSS
jgi:hypothetical protein